MASDAYPIVFFSKMAQAVPSMGPVLRQCEGGIFVSNRSETLRFFATNYPNVPSCRYPDIVTRLSRAHRLLAGAKVIVSGAGHRSILDRYSSPKAMIFHGTYRALGRENLAAMAGFDHVFLNGPRMERMLMRFEGEFAFDYSVTGYMPFREFPEPTLENREQYLGKLGLRADIPTVFYAPARRDCGSWIDCAEAIAREVPPRYNLIMRPHPNQALHGTKSERALFHRIENILRERDNAVVDLAVCSFPELMCVADVLIADATSPNEEFMFYDRPQIITETYPREKWRELYVADGLHDHDVAELVRLYDCAWSYTRGDFRDWGHAVEHALANPDTQGPARRDYFAAAFGTDVREAPLRAVHVLKLMAS